MRELVGTTLGQYQVLELLGEGGMARVYKVWDKVRSTHLALKLLREDLAEDRVFIRRFQREAQTLERLQHPSIVRFYGLEREGIQAFMLVDFIDGFTLRTEIARMEGHAMAGKRILEIMRPVCSALQYAHSKSIVHCDIKPANIMINRNGTVLVSDFGIARMTEGSTTVTMAGAGTPAYMAPEQIMGADPSPLTDIYALGVVLFEMLTGGERPFTGEHAKVTGTSGEKVRWEHINLAPQSPRRYNREIPLDLEAVVMKCLDKDPARRYASPMDLLAALEQALGNFRAVATPGLVPTPAEEPTALPERGVDHPEKVQPQRTDKKLGWVAALLVILCIGVVAVGGVLIAPLLTKTATPTSGPVYLSTPTIRKPISTTKPASVSPTLAPPTSPPQRVVAPTTIAQLPEQWNGVYSYVTGQKQNITLYIEKVNGLTFTGKMIWQSFGSARGAILRAVGEFVTDFGDSIEQTKWNNLDDYRNGDRSGAWLKWTETEIIDGGNYTVNGWYYAHIRKDGTMVAVYFYNDHETVADKGSITLKKVGP